jgi:hypothetical protein
MQSRGRGNAFKFALSTQQSMEALYINLAVPYDCLSIEDD